MAQLPPWQQGEPSLTGTPDTNLKTGSIVFAPKQTSKREQAVIIDSGGKSPAGVSNLLASLGHTGRRVVLGHTLNTLQRVTTKKKKISRLK